MNSQAFSMFRRGGAWSLVALMALASVAIATPQEEFDLTTVRGRGQACTQWFYAQEFDKIEALGVTQAMTDALAPMGGFEGFWNAVDSQLGAETGVVSEEETKQQGLDVYMRTATFEKAPVGMQVMVQWVFDGEGVIAGFAIQPKQ